METTEHVKNIVIGSGQAGTPLAMALAGKGESTVLIEARHVGGTCVNYGCTPTKTMVASARAAYVVSRAGDYGVEVSDVSMRLENVRERKRSIVNTWRSGSLEYINNTRNLQLVPGEASFIDNHTVEIRSSDGAARRMTGERIFINTGTRPSVPSMKGIESVPFLTNETIMELGHVPEHLLIVGGGYIGLEFGQMFRRFGSRVTILQRNEQLLPREDTDVAEEVASIMEEEGITLLLNAQPESITGTGEQLTLSFVQAREKRRVTGSHLLIAAGRRPNTDMLSLEKTDIQTDERGYIYVNDRLETGVEGVWALGDVKGGPAFTHISYDDYRVVYRNLYGDGNGSIAGRIVPYTVFIDPQLGRVGLTEKEARRRKKNIKVAVLSMSSVARAIETEETRGLMKAIIDSDTDTIVGFAMVGIQGGEIAGAVQIAMMGNLPYTALRDGAFSHPTLIESLNNLFATV